MHFHVRMDVRLPHDMDQDTLAQLVAREKAYSQQLQRSGKWPHIWRIVGSTRTSRSSTSRPTTSCIR